MLYMSEKLVKPINALIFFFIKYFMVQGYFYFFFSESSLLIATHTIYGILMTTMIRVYLQ